MGSGYGLFLSSGHSPIISECLLTCQGPRTFPARARQIKLRAWGTLHLELGTALMQESPRLDRHVGVSWTASQHHCELRANHFKGMNLAGGPERKLPDRLRKG